MAYNTWKIVVERMYKAKCVLQYKFEGGICSVLMPEVDSYMIAYLETMPPDELGSDYTSTLEKEILDLKPIDVISHLAKSKFLSRKVAFVDWDFSEHLHNMAAIINQISPEEYSFFLQKCQAYLNRTFNN